jgi:hypothetical protein
MARTLVNQICDIFSLGWKLFYLVDCFNLIVRVWECAPQTWLLIIAARLRHAHTGVFTHCWRGHQLPSVHSSTHSTYAPVVAPSSFASSWRTPKSWWSTGFDASSCGCLGIACAGISLLDKHAYYWHWVFLNGYGTCWNVCRWVTGTNQRNRQRCPQKRDTTNGQGLLLLWGWKAHARWKRISGGCSDVCFRFVCPCSMSASFDAIASWSSSAMRANSCSSLHHGNVGS